MEIALLQDTRKALEYFADKLAFTLGPSDLHKNPQAFQIVDVRRAEDYAAGHIPGAVSLPESQWQSLAGLRKDKVNVLYCYSQTCHLAPRAAVQFAGQGYPVMEMEGGFDAWKDFGYQVDPSPGPVGKADEDAFLND